MFYATKVLDPRLNACVWKHTDPLWRIQVSAMACSRLHSHGKNAWRCWRHTRETDIINKTARSFGPPSYREGARPGVPGADNKHVFQLFFSRPSLSELSVSVVAAAAAAEVNRHRTDSQL